MKQALMLIDIQNDYFPGGKHPLTSAREAAESAARVLSRFRQVGLPVLHVQHVSLSPDASFFLPDTPGAELYADVKPLPAERVFVKHAPNAFYGTGLTEELADRDITQLTVCGMMSHMCVDTTVRAARDHGLKVTLLYDACATRDLTFAGKTVPAELVQAAFMAALDGSFARAVSTQEFLDGFPR